MSETEPGVAARNPRENKLIRILKKLYLTVFYACLVYGISIFGLTVGFFLHDRYVFSKLPNLYRSAISKLESSAVPSREEWIEITKVEHEWRQQGLILKNDETSPDEILEYLNADSNHPIISPLRDRTLERFHKAAGFWGYNSYQAEISEITSTVFLGFLPLLVVWIIQRWLIWLVR